MSMWIHFKELCIVLIASAITFALGKSFALAYATFEEFSNRKRLWYLISVIAFLSPNPWVLIVLSVPILIFVGRKDANPVALFAFLLNVIPQIFLANITMGSHKLFEITTYRVLIVTLLLPLFLNLRQKSATNKNKWIQSIDVLIVAWIILQVAIYIPPDLADQSMLEDSMTNMLRRAFLLFFDVYLLYYVTSRYCSNTKKLKEVIAFYSLGILCMSLIATIEFLKHWLLYADIVTDLSTVQQHTVYLIRNGVVRARAAASHSLVLGYLIVLSLSFWLYFRTTLPSTSSRKVISFIYLFGLLATYSRGPWAGSVVVVVGYAALQPQGLFRAIQVSFLILGVGLLLVISPFGGMVSQVVPFLGGKVDVGNIVYRQQLFDEAWSLIKENPFLGDPTAYLRMQDMRQGEGIIDLVNSYLQMALYYGLVGLFLFVSPMLLSIREVLRVAKLSRPYDKDFALLGVSIAAAILGSLFMISSISFMPGLAEAYYLLCAFSVAYARIHQSASEGHSHSPVGRTSLG